MCKCWSSFEPAQRLFSKQTNKQTCDKVSPEAGSPHYLVNLQEWKGGTGLMGAFSPKFCPEPDQSALMVPRMPELKLCRMVGNGHLEIPQEVRAKWLGDPVRSTWVRYQNRVSIPFSILKGLKGICCLVEFNFCVLIQDPDWRVRLKNFDSVFAPTDNPTAAPAPEPVPQDANKDLGQDLPTPERAVDGQKLLTPPALSKEDFDAQYKDCEVKAVTLSVGAQNLTRSIVNDKVYLSATMNSPSRLLGVQTPSSKPLFLYAGGSWVSEDSKAGRELLSFQALRLCDNPARPRTSCRKRPTKTKLWSSVCLRETNWCL